MSCLKERPWSLRDTQSAPVSSPQEVGGLCEGEGVTSGGLRRGWRQGPCQGAENTGGFLRPPRHPSCPEQMRRGGRGRPPRVQPPPTPCPGSSGTCPPLPESSPYCGHSGVRGPDLYRTTATRWQMQGSQPSAWRTAPRVRCLQDVKSKQGGGQACGEQESHVSRKVTVRGKAERPPAGPGLQGLPLRKET